MWRIFVYSFIRLFVSATADRRCRLSVVGCPFDLSLNTVDYLGHLGFGGLEDAICCSPFVVCSSTADRRSLKHRNPATTLEKSQINGLPLSISMERGLGGEVIATAKARTTVSPSPDPAGGTYSCLFVQFGAGPPPPKGGGLRAGIRG